MSRAGVKAQPVVRRAGPAPMPGGEDWWAEVEAVSKTSQGAARLNRDRLFHEKLLAALDAPVQAEVFEHAMLRKLGNALKTVANVCTPHMYPPPHMIHVSSSSYDTHTHTGLYAHDAAI